MRLPTPAGVPVKITSPGSSGQIADRRSTIPATPKTIEDVRSACTVSPLTAQEIARSSRLAGGVTTHGPIGPKPGNDLPRLNCGGEPRIWTSRADRAWPTGNPATRPAAPRRARAPGTPPHAPRLPDPRHQLPLPVELRRRHADRGLRAGQARRELR